MPKLDKTQYSKEEAARLMEIRRLEKLGKQKKEVFATRHKPIEFVEEFNQEFKRYLMEKGVNIDVTMFDLEFEPPQNFAAYRKSELDNARVPTFTQMSAIPYVSNRFALKRYLGMSAEEIA